MIYGMARRKTYFREEQVTENFLDQIFSITQTTFGFIA